MLSIRDVNRCSSAACRQDVQYGTGRGRALLRCRTTQLVFSLAIIIFLLVVPNTMTLFKRFAKDESGATAIEYGLIAGLINIEVAKAPGPNRHGRSDRVQPPR